MEKLFFTVSYLESKLPSSQSKIQNLKDDVLVVAKKLKEDTGTAATGWQVVSDMQIKLHALE